MVNGKEQYMQRCLDLASQGIPDAFPNPLVGAVIVHEGKVIGEGYHQKYGGAHAEVNAIQAVKDKKLLKESTIYVNLEPCAHYGKTPPCAKLIAEHELKECVIASVDPNPKVSGKGINMIESAGVKVERGILKKEAVELNKRFFTCQLKKRPYVVLKWAQTKDGYLADREGNSKWISNEYSRVYVHKWRTEETAIMVGRNTAEVDNPNLTVRDWYGKNPIRLVIDKDLMLDKALNIFNAESQTIIFNSLKEEEDLHLQYVKLDFGKEIIDQVLKNLYKKNIQSIFVEGGSKTLESFIKNGFWDEARVFTGQQYFKEGTKAPEIRIKPNVKLDINGDELIYIYNPKNIIYEI